MTEKLDAAITSVQDFVLDRIGGVMTEQEATDLAGRITLLVNESRFPFEMEMIDMNRGVVITVPEQYSVQEVIHIRRSFVELIKSDVPVFVCRSGLKIHKFHADLMIAARRFAERCYACRGTGVVGQENETPMNCGVCADIRAALKFFDKHNIPQSQEKDTIPPEKVVFQHGDPVLYEKKQALFDTYLRTVSHQDDRGWHWEETTEPQPQARIRFGDSSGIPAGKDLPVVQTEELQPWVHSSSSMPPK